MWTAVQPDQTDEDRGNATLRTCGFTAATLLVVVEQDVELAFAGAGQFKQRDAKAQDARAARQFWAHVAP